MAHGFCPFARAAEHAAQHVGVNDAVAFSMNF
jgi:hypothetical protein